jgi:uncharacterized repeat protein (TIGR03837 family)
MPDALRWDLFCHVVDNFGDVGVCWRLAADLAERGDRVRLWIDDPAALAWMAPQGHPGVEVRGWPAADDAGVVPHEAVIEAFGCHLPEGFIRAMAARSPPPVWINLEYLSAEDYVERSHRLPSPQLAGPGRGLTKHFFYPGLTARTGGLIRETDLAARRQAFDAAAWLRARDIEPAAGERCASLFCYANDALPALLDALAAEPTLLLVTPGPATQQVRALQGAAARRGALRLHYLPALTQRDYDHLLWACALNLVRGEDSFVRAQWAGTPLLWQIYPQSDGVHAGKLDAFLGQYLAGAPADLAAAVRDAMAAWNGLANAPTLRLPAWSADSAWAAQARAWRERLLTLPDLAAGLRAFVREAR